MIYRILQLLKGNLSLMMIKSSEILVIAMCVHLGPGFTLIIMLRQISKSMVSRSPGLKNIPAILCLIMRAYKRSKSSSCYII